MLDYIKEILTSPAGSVTQVILIFVGFFFLVWKVSHFHTKYSEIDKTNSKIDGLEDKFKNNLDRFDNKMDDMKQSIMTLNTLFQVHFNSNNPLAQRQSPISLTEIGKTVVSEISAEKTITEHWKEIKKRVDKELKEDCNPYDIQVASFKIGDVYLEILDENEIENVKKSAFERGYDLKTYELPFGILIRDKYLRERGFAIEDVDKHDPEKIITNQPLK